jgi:3-deoxy-7-phosphoheptulonate synthase
MPRPRAAAWPESWQLTTSAKETKFRFPHRIPLHPASPSRLNSALEPGKPFVTLHSSFSTIAVSQEHPTDDLRIERIRPLLSPALLMDQLPLGEAESAFVESSRRTAEDILKLRDDRLLVVTGPCSIHDHKSALEYAHLLKQARTKYAADLEIVMRVYFEKPRTTVGWKGYINDPDLNESFDINKGLREARKLLIEIVQLGLPTGTEFLDVITPQYIADTIVWGAIGARTTESQVHRQLASGLSMPVGFKNGTDGGVQIALDAIQASAGKHHFLSVTKEGVAAIVTTRGNDACHVILRGGKQPNFDAPSIANVVSQLKGKNLPASVMVDCSHGNSMKDYRRQPEVAASLCQQIASGDKSITGLMLESHLVEGNQSKPEVYGKSITDACINWQTTETVLEQLATAVRTRRSA